MRAARTTVPAVKADKRTRVTTDCYNAAIVACGRRGQWTKALALLREVQDAVGSSILL